MRYSPPTNELKRHLRTLLDDQVNEVHICFDEVYVRFVSRQSFSL